MTVSDFFLAHQADRFEQFLFAGLYIATCGTPESKTVRLLLHYGTNPKYFNIRKLNFMSLLPYIPGGYGVEGSDRIYSINVLFIPVNSSRLCGLRSNLNLVKHIWDTYIFSFYKYDTLIFPSSERVAYIKDRRAESNEWLSPACSL